MTATNVGQPTKVYRMRWFVLFVLALLHFSVALIMFSYVVVANFVDQFYCMTKGCRAANALIITFMVVNVPAGFVAMAAINAWGLRFGVLTGAWLSLGGAAIKILSASPLLPVFWRLPIALFGAFLGASGLPCILYLPAAMAARWFPAHQRATAVSLASLSFPLGTLVITFASSYIVQSKDDVFLHACVTAIPLSIATVLATVGITRSAPKVAPSQAAVQTPPRLLAGALDALRTPAYLILVLFATGIGGSMNALNGLIQQILCPQGYSNLFVGRLTTIGTLGTFVGGFATGRIVDRTKRFRLVVKSCAALVGALSLVLMILAQRPGMDIPLIGAMLLYRMGAFGLFPICMELAADITYPNHPATTTGFIQMFLQLQSASFMTALPLLSSEVDPADMPYQACTKQINGTLHTVVVSDWTNPLYAWSGYIVTMAIVACFFFWPKLKRTEAERQHSLPTISGPLDAKK